MTNRNEKVAKIFGWEIDEYGNWYNPHTLQTYQGMEDHPPQYDSDPALLGEMLAWFDERGYQTQIDCLPRLHDRKVAFKYRAHLDFAKKEIADTRNIALCDALIQETENV